MIVKPSVSKRKVTLNSQRTSLQIATSGGLEIASVLVTAGGGAAAVRIYDSKNGAAEGTPSIDSFLVAANAGESTPYCPAQPILMKNGIYAELEQGADSNGEAFITIN